MSDKPIGDPEKYGPPLRGFAQRLKSCEWRYSEQLTPYVWQSSCSSAHIDKRVRCPSCDGWVKLVEPKP